MFTKEVVVKNKSGIHARPAAEIVGIAVKFRSSVFLKKGEDRVNAKSILGVIALGASYDTRLTIETEGEDEVRAAETLAQVFNSVQEENNA
ncbi:hypothetical protein LSH36_1091g00167 [Paralvinella palmiformis]|uniref:HPr domain-containing protein n=1 Tax=Paralvinella palmiformis TaxID=53620 RepID=A0AAD9IWC7_9ANNE|nr:hypothetical protein LSH36_1091g00167 [Paralvinella palmiformis]